MKRLIALLGAVLSCMLFAASSYATYTVEQIHDPLLMYMDMKYDQAIEDASPDALLLQDLDTDYEYLKSQIDDLLWQLSDGGATLEEAIDVISPLLAQYLGLLKFIASGEESISLSDADVQKVESEVLKYQKDIIAILKKYFILPEHDIQEETDFTINFTSSSADVHIDAPRIITTALVDSGTTSVDADVDFEITVHPSFGSDTVILDGMVGFVITIDHGDTYISLDAFDIDASGDATMVKYFNENTLPELEYYYEKLSEKPLMIPASMGTYASASLTSEALMSLISILEEAPLFTPYAVSYDGRYLLQYKEDTLVSIAYNMGEDITRDDIQYMQSDIRDSELYMEVTDRTHSSIGIAVEEYDATGSISLSRVGADYTFLIDVVGTGDAVGNEAYLMLSDGFAKGYVTVDDITYVDLFWEHGKLSLFATDAYMFEMVVEGTLKSDEADLDFTYNDIPVGSVQYGRGIQDAYFSIDIDLSEVLPEDVMFDISATSSWQEGKYQVDVPSDFWLMDDLYEDLYGYDDYSYDWGDDVSYDYSSCDEYLGYLNCLAYNTDVPGAYDLYETKLVELYDMDSDEANAICDESLDRLYLNREKAESTGCYLWY